MHARAFGFVFERHQSSDFFVEKLYGMRACALAVHALARAARGAARDDGSCSLGVLGGSAAKWTNVVWPIKSRPTNQQTNKHTLLFYRYIYGQDSRGMKANCKCHFKNEAVMRVKSKDELNYLQLFRLKHMVPFPVYPDLHAQVKLVSVSVHSAAG